MPRVRRLLRFVPAVAFAIAGGTARAEWIADVELNAAHETNVARAPFAYDDNTAWATASVRKIVIPSDGGVLSLSTELTGANYRRYPGLSHLDVTVGASYQQKFGLGPEAPWLRVRGSISRLSYRQKIRDGWSYLAGLEAGRRFGERLDLRIGYAVEERIADQRDPIAELPDISGAVFTQRSRTFTANADYLLSDRLALSLGYARRRGDITSTSPINFDVFPVSTAIQFDPAFGPEAVAYRLDALAHTYSVGLGHAIGEKSSVSVGVDRLLAYGAGGNNYYSTLSRVTFAHRF